MRSRIGQGSKVVCSRSSESKKAPPSANTRKEGKDSCVGCNGLEVEGVLVAGGLCEMGSHYMLLYTVVKHTQIDASIGAPFDALVKCFQGIQRRHLRAST